MTSSPSPLVAILVGSDSDLPVVEETTKTLDEFGVPFELHVSSAHRTPERTKELVGDAEKCGVRIFIAGAGGAAHLPGVVASFTRRPVIGIPFDATSLGGFDALLSIVQMPPGIPVGCVGIGKFGAKNSALLAVAILALSDPALDAKLAAFREKQAAGVVEKDRKQQEARKKKG
jgi:phosphoribosylaminoimidazole carboxylase PurE protein